MKKVLVGKIIICGNVEVIIDFIFVFLFKIMKLLFFLILVKELIYIFCKLRLFKLFRFLSVVFIVMIVNYVRLVNVWYEKFMIRIDYSFFKINFIRIKCIFIWMCIMRKFFFFDSSFDGWCSKGIKKERKF